MSTPAPRDVWAVDPAALLHTPTRRLLCAAQELTGGELVVTAEAWRRVWTGWELAAHGAAEREARALRRRGLHPDMDEAQLAASLREAKLHAGRAWLEEEPGHADAPWRYADEDGEGGRIERALSQSGLFRDAGGPDARVVAQALAAGVQRLLAAKTDGVASDGALNAWIEEQGLPAGWGDAPRPPFLTDPDAALMEKAERMGTRRVGPTLVGWLRAAWAPHGGGRESAPRVHGALERSAQAAATQGLASVASVAVHTLDGWGAEGLAERLEGLPCAAATMRSEARLAAKERELRREMGV